jgi:ribulose-phosphate 3-epimerase
MVPTMKTEIIPAILPKDFAELQDKIEFVRGQVKTVQIDICDGQFVHNATWPYKKHDDSFDRILKEEEGLPGWESLDYEFDLMVNKPEEVISDWIIAGAARIVIHAEATGDLLAAMNAVPETVEVGLALNIETDISQIADFKDKIKFVQCMGIDHVGFQGQEFDAKVIEKIKAIKAKYPDLPVSVDGGVSLETAPLLKAAGADRLVIGSAIFNSDNAFEAIRKFKRMG